MKNFKFLIGVLISLIFLYLTFRKTSFNDVFSAFKQVNYLFLTLGIIVHLSGFWLRTFRWQKLLSKIKIVSLKELFPVLAIGYMANNTLPFRAGEVARAYVLGSKEGVSKSATLATIVVERIFDGLSLLFFVSLLSFFVREEWKQWVGITILAAFAFGISVIGLYSILNFKKQTLSFINFFLKKSPSNISNHLNNLVTYFIDGFEIIKIKRILLEVFLMSVGIWLVETLVYYLIALSFHISLPFASMLFLVSIVNIIITIPSAPGYIGTFEFFVKQILVLFSVSEPLAVGYSLGVHLALWLPITLLGAIFVSRLGVSLNMQKLAER